jgi:hypothetical protein
MMPLLLAAAQLLAGDVYIHDADQNARAIIAQTQLKHSTRDKSLWTELAGQIAADISRAKHHLKAAPPELAQRLDAAERANVQLQASLGVENHAEVRNQAESVLAQLVLAKQALASAEQAAGVVALERVQPPLRQPVRGNEPVPPGEDRVRNPPPPAPKGAVLPVPEQPGNVTEPPPAIQPPR